MTAIGVYLIAIAAAIAVGLLRSYGNGGERDPRARSAQAWGRSDGTIGRRAPGIHQSPGDLNRRVDRPAA